MPRTKSSTVIGIIAGLGPCLTWASSSAMADITCGQIGPDIIVGDMHGVSNYTAEGGIDAFSVNVAQCNIGTANLSVIIGTPDHPTTTSNLYRLSTVNGATRIEHIGMGWIFHTSTALSQNLCCSCNGQGGAVLGIGCSNVHNSGVMGNQSVLSPRWQVNATTGTVLLPLGDPAFSGTIARRLQAGEADINPALNAGATYFAELHTLSPDDAGAGNGANNAAYRRVTFTGVSPNFNVSIAPGATTQRGQPAIMAWAAADPQVLITTVTAPDGVYLVGARVTDLGRGTWHYEYAIENINSDRSLRSVSVPAGGSVSVTNVGFHDVAYHSGDGIGDVTTNGTDWPGSHSAGAVSWSTDTHAANPNANAIRWATLYNFRFDADRPPVAGDVALETFKVPGSLTAQSLVPQPILCPADATSNGVVNIEDLLFVISQWGSTSGPGDVNSSGTVDISDLLAVIAAWGPCA